MFLPHVLPSSPDQTSQGFGVRPCASLFPLQRATGGAGVPSLGVACERRSPEFGTFLHPPNLVLQVQLLAS